ncbi:MAG: hypothetical protein M1821_001681 [Bathelium mastoideum]|nr:MAG: hypothetical protein M1821_001681 [Bathelium mastoideum]
MSDHDNPPPYPGVPNAGNLNFARDTDIKILHDEKKTPYLQAEYTSQAGYNSSNFLQTGASGPRPSSAPDSNDDPKSTTHGQSSPTIPGQASNVPPAIFFHIYTTKRAWHRELDVTINGKTDVAFHVTFAACRFSSSKPDMTVQRGSASGPIIATAQYPCGFKSLKRVASLDFPSTEANGEKGAQVQVVPTAICRRGYGLVLEGRALEWKGTHHNGASKWSGSSLKLVDESGRIYAVYADTTYKAWTKQGRLSIEVPGLSDVLIEQIVCSALVIVEHERRTQAAAAAA